jgi:hypothetical protein
MCLGDLQTHTASKLQSPDQVVGAGGGKQLLLQGGSRGSRGFGPQHILAGSVIKHEDFCWLKKHLEVLLPGRGVHKTPVAATGDPEKPGFLRSLPVCPQQPQEW